MRMTHRASLESGRAAATAFALSSEDKNQQTPRLSVWMVELTTLEEAWILTGSARERRVALILEVDAIRALKPLPAEPPHLGLEVEWERATVLDESGSRIPDARLGSEGHAGIARLDDRFGTRAQRKDLRAQLARMATVRILSEVELDRIAPAP